MFQSLELEKLINSWNLILGSTRGEFKALSHQVISHLYRNSDFEKISRVIHSELIVYYGLEITKKEADDFTKEIFDWWLST